MASAVAPRATVGGAGGDPRQLRLQRSGAFGVTRVQVRQIEPAGAVFGGITVNLAALTQALTAGPEASPHREKRWIAPVAAGITYIVLGLLAGVATAFVSASPPVLIEAVAGLALMSALIGAVVAAVEDVTHRLSAILTFLVTASGIVVAGIGSAFWGLLAGAIAMLWLGWQRRPEPHRIPNLRDRGA